MMKSAEDLNIVENWSKISNNRLEILIFCTYGIKNHHNLIKIGSYIIIWILKFQNNNVFINIYKNEFLHYITVRARKAQRFFSGSRLARWAPGKKFPTSPQMNVFETRFFSRGLRPRTPIAFQRFFNANIILSACKFQKLSHGASSPDPIFARAELLRTKMYSFREFV